MKVTLKILEKDIWKYDYTDADNCPITKALQRAGFNLREGGAQLTNGTTLLPIGIDTPKELLETVLSMYAHKHISFGHGYLGKLVPIEPKDFEFEMELPDEYLYEKKIK